MKHLIPKSPVEWAVALVLAALIIAIGCTTTTKNQDGSVTTQGLDPVATQAIITILPQLIELAKDDPAETSMEREREAEMLEMKLRMLERILIASGVYRPTTSTATIVPELTMEGASAP